MIATFHQSSRLFLALVLVASILPRAARAESPIGGRSVADISAAFVPIGRLKSLGVVSINGRSVYGEETIWAGDLLQTSAAGRGVVLLDSLGQVVLEKDATVRLAAKPESSTADRVLIITVMDGSAAVYLEDGVAGHVEAGQSAWSASSGAKFRVEVRGSRASTTVMKGRLDQELITKRTYNVRLVKPVLTPNRVMEVKKNQKATTEAQVGQVVETQKKGASIMRVFFDSAHTANEFQAAVETPAPGKRVQFSLNKNIGEIRPNVTTTDAQGIARTTFTAGSKLDEGDLTATVLDLKHTDTEIEFVNELTVHIRVIKGGFWTKKKVTIVAAAAVLGGICIFACNPKPGPLQTSETKVP